MVATTSSPRMIFTRARYDAMVAAGFLTKEDRVELLYGEIYQKTPNGPKHTARVNRITKTLERLLGNRSIISGQNPVALNEFSEPEPDISVLKPRQDFYESGHPEPRDVLFLVEVSDSTLTHDRDPKVPLYAACDVAEVWLVDVQARTVTVHRAPEGNRYTNVITYAPGQSIPLAAFPGEEIAVDELGL